MPNPNPNLPASIRKEPLMAGVEENLVYRLLVSSRTGKGRPRSRRDLACYGFPFSAERWRDLDLTLISARDYAQAIWAYRCYPRGFGSRRHLYRIGLAILLMGIIGALFNFAPGYTSTATFFVSLYIAIEGHAWGSRIKLRRVLTDMVHEFRMIRQTKKKDSAAVSSLLKFTVGAGSSLIILLVLTMILWSLVLAFSGGISGKWLPLYFMGGACMILICSVSFLGENSPSDNLKNQLFIDLIAEMELFMLLRREGDNG